MIAHRGASAYAPENTIAAFDEALQKGCSFLEFDVMLSQDGIPFVFHDDSLKRTTRTKGMFATKNASELKNLDAGKWFSRKFKNEPIPSFESVLKWMIKNDVQANIEIKPTKGTTKQTATTVLTYINKYWPHDKIMPLLSSFDHEALTICRQLSPEVPIGLLLDKWNNNWHQVAKELDCYSIHLGKHIARRARIEEIKSHGYQLYVYTVNRKRKARSLLNLGVDAVFSDYPDLIS